MVPFQDRFIDDPFQGMVIHPFALAFKLSEHVIDHHRLKHVHAGRVNWSTFKQ